MTDSALRWEPTQRAAPWRQEVQRRVLALSSEVEALDHGETAKTEGEALRRALKHAWELADRRAGLLEWWNGILIEEAWGYLREVEERVAEAASAKEVPALVAEVRSHARAYIPQVNPLVAEFRRLAKKDPGAPAIRPYAVKVLRLAHQLADDSHREARALRNRLLVSAACLAMFAILVALGERWLEWGLVPAQDGAPSAPWQRAVVVMVFGGLGALIGAIPGLTHLPKQTSPFKLPGPLLLLKVPLGALSAFVGVALVAGFEGVTINSSTAVIAFALVFGAGQEAVSRYLNEKATKILTATSTEVPSPKEAPEESAVGTTA